MKRQCEIIHTRKSKWNPALEWSALYFLLSLVKSHLNLSVIFVSIFEKNQLNSTMDVYQASLLFAIVFKR